MYALVYLLSYLILCTAPGTSGLSIHWHSQAQIKINNKNPLLSATKYLTTSLVIIIHLKAVKEKK